MSRNYFRERRRLAATATTGEISFDSVAVNRRYWIQNLSAKDNTTAAAVITPVIRGHGYDYELTAFVLTTANRVYSWDWGFILNPGEQLVFKLSAIVSGDQLDAYISGHWEEVEESATV